VVWLHGCTVHNDDSSKLINLSRLNDLIILIAIAIIIVRRHNKNM
jgi:hypothetical protein